MDFRERDAQLLSVFDPEDREKLEEAVDEIVDQEIPDRSVVGLLAYASSFERAAQDQREDKKIVGLAIAASLRMRARQAMSRQDERAEPGSGGRVLH